MRDAGLVGAHAPRQSSGGSVWWATASWPSPATDLLRSWSLRRPTWLRQRSQQVVCSRSSTVVVDIRAITRIP